MMHSVNTIGQNNNNETLNSIVHLERFSDKLCDSIFNIKKLQEEGKMPMFTNESMPYPILQNKYANDYSILVGENKKVNSGTYVVFVELIVLSDSLPKCIHVIKSENKELNAQAIQEVGKLRFVPAIRNKMRIPYFCNIKLIMKK